LVEDRIAFNKCSKKEIKELSQATIMKHKYLLIALLGAAALATGCERSEKSTSETRETTAQQLDKVKTDTKEAAQDMKDYAYAQKSEFVTKMQGQLDEINRELDQLATKIEKASDAAKTEAKPKLQALRDQTANLTKQLDEAKNATESTWDDVKAGFRKGYSEVKDGFQQARQWVSDKIAP
jgi:cytochrome c556